MDLPNELICQFYQYLNPKDQTRFSLTNKTIRDCIPNWKFSHQKLFIHCIKEINKLKYGITDGTVTQPGIKVGFDEHIRILGYKCFIRNIYFQIINDPTSVSWRISNKEIKYYYTQTSGTYNMTYIQLSDSLHIRTFKCDKKLLVKAPLLWFNGEYISESNHCFTRRFDYP